MRFKVYFNEQTKQLDINCLKDTFTSNDVIIPDNFDQHVHFPIPNDMDKKIREYIANIIADEDTSELEKIHNNINDLITERRELIYKFREKYNPLIVKACEQFKDDHAEWFI